MLTHMLASSPTGHRRSWCLTIRDGSVCLRDDDSGLVPISVNADGELVISLQQWIDLGLKVKNDVEPIIRIG